jgi:transcriptional regulator with XRE-family HTH domain
LANIILPDTHSGCLRLLTRRHELRPFLTAARGRLRPEDVGLPSGGQRRSLGLRREEVAELVGVSANWYAMFEAGTSDRTFSTAFVRRVADALRLDSKERAKLFMLALPEAAAAVSTAEEMVRDARITAGRALAQSVCQRLMAAHSVLEAKAAGGRALASAICRHVRARLTS